MSLAGNSDCRQLDEFTRECLAIETATSLPARAVIAVLQRLFAEHGAPEFIAKIVKRFHGKFRDECLNMETFANLAEATVVIEAWRHEYNIERPHSSLGYLTPLQFKAQWQRAQSATENGRERPSSSLLGATDVGDEDGPSSSPGPSSVRPPLRRSGRTADASVRTAEPYPPSGQTGM